MSREEKLGKSLDDIISAKSKDYHGPKSSVGSDNHFNRGSMRQRGYKRNFRSKQSFHPYRGQAFRRPHPSRNQTHRDKFQNDIVINRKDSNKSLINKNFHPSESVLKTDLLFTGEGNLLELSVTYDKTEILQIDSDGKIHLLFLTKVSQFAKEESQLIVRNIINKVLRPFHFFLMRKETESIEDEIQVSWYLMDGERYKAKVIAEKPIVMGPTTGDLAKERVGLLKKLHENELLLTPEKFNLIDNPEQGSSKAFNSPVSALMERCRKRGWQQIKFWVDREIRNNIHGFVWTIIIEDVGLTIQPKPHMWNADESIAKNYAAENALTVLKKF